MSITRERIEEIVAAFATADVVVAGDFLADVYIEARPAKLSREAPVMVARWCGEHTIPGGAANAVNNLVALGAQVRPVGIIHRDEPGRMLLDFFQKNCVDTAGLVEQDELETVRKTRVMLGEEGRSMQQVLRLDREPEELPSKRLRQAVAERLAAAAREARAVILSDYGYGLVDQDLVRVLEPEGKRLIVAADSRSALAEFQGVDLITPNHQEAAEIVGHPVLEDDDVRAAGREIRSRLGARLVIVTRGNRGMMVDDGDEQVFIAASGPAGEVTDVSGAGDTVIAVATLALMAGATAIEAAEIANHAAGVVVTRLGAATISPRELVEAVVPH